MDKRGVKLKNLFIRYFLIMGVISAIFIAFLFWFYGFSDKNGYISPDQMQFREIESIPDEILN